MATIPSKLTKRYSQTNAGDFSGNIKQTKNISFDNKGYITLAKRTRLIHDSGTYTNLIKTTSVDNAAVMSFCRTGLNNGRIWVAGTKTLHYLNSDLTLTEDATASTPTLEEYGQNEMCSFYAASAEYLLVANSASTVKTFSGTAWGTVATDVSFGKCITVFENLRCAVVGGANLVQLIDSSLTKSTLLTLPPNYVVIKLVWNSNKLYIATIDTTTNFGGVFEWDGISAEASYFHGFDGYQVLGMCRYKTGVSIVLSDGRLLKIDGGVSRLAEFPIYYSGKQWQSEGTNRTPTGRKMDRGSMVADGDEIYMTVDARYEVTNNDDTDDYFENDFPSGVWCFDPEVGLYCKYTIDGSARIVTGAITTANVDTSTDIITIPSSICPDTGTPVFYDDGSDGAGTLLAPLKFNTRYFVIKLSGTTLKLATTYANAIAGTAIDLTATGNNSQTLSFHSNAGFGGINQIPKSIFLYKSASLADSSETSKATKMLIGSQISKTTVTFDTGGIHAVEHKQENRGYVIYPKIPSGDITDTFNRIYAKFGRLATPESKLVIKYRKSSNEQYQRKLHGTYGQGVTGTWVDSTSFTTTDVTDMSVGDEIEIINGAGSGYTAHIVSITGSSSPYTIVIDETVQNISASQTFFYLVDNWTKAGVIDNTREDWAHVSVGKEMTSIDIKIELRGEDVRLEEMKPASSTKQKAL